MLNSRLKSALIPIFPDINDLPTPPNESQGSNGSYLVQKVNDLVAGFQPSTESWVEGKEFFLDSVGGDDANTGEAGDVAVKTFDRLTQIVGAKAITKSVVLRLAGTVSPPLNMSGLVDMSPMTWPEITQVTITKWTGGSNPTILGSGFLVVGTPSRRLELIFASCKFDIDLPGQVLSCGAGKVAFQGCQFNARIDGIPAAFTLRAQYWVDFSGCSFTATSVNSGIALLLQGASFARMSASSSVSQATVAKAEERSQLLLYGDMGASGGFAVDKNGEIHFLTPEDNTGVLESVGSEGGKFVRGEISLAPLIYTFPGFSPQVYNLLAGGGRTMTISRLRLYHNGTTDPGFILKIGTTFLSTGPLIGDPAGEAKGEWTYEADNVISDPDDTLNLDVFNAGDCTWACLEVFYS